MKILSSIFSVKTTDGIAAIGSAALSTIFSPSWWLTKSLLAPYLNVDQLMASGLSTESLLKASLDLHGLGSQVLLQQVLPILALCLAASFAYLFLSCWFGKKLFNFAFQRLQVKVSA